MNRRDTDFLRLSAAFLCLNLAGCGTTSTVEPLAGGYEEITYTGHSTSEPSAHQTALKYRTSDRTRIIIWPSVARPVIRKGVAVFVGHRASEPQPSDINATEQRLFAVQAPGPVLDITDEVLWRWSKESGKDFMRVRKAASITYIGERQSKIELQFDLWITEKGPDPKMTLDWTELLDVMREVKEKGVLRKDRVWGTRYLEKEFKSETQK